MAVGRPFGTLRSASCGNGPWGCGSFALCAWAVWAAGVKGTGAEDVGISGLCGIQFCCGGMTLV